jgi:energy-coupling factor transporter ATP-binding protein EcfA2
VIRFEQVTVTYPDAARPVLRGVDLEVPEGELALVVGPTGSGKSTLLSCVNGLVPHFTGGTLRGRVTVDGRDTRSHPPRELADIVGWVGQDPIAGFVTDTVEDELAYVMESLAVPAPVMRRRVEEVVDLLGLADLRDRPLLSLSAGQQQRVAIGAVLTASPRVLVLDEPTSALDPPAAEEVLAVLTRMVHDLALTVLLAEHRLERVVQYADRVVVVESGEVRQGDPATLLESAPVAPPVVQLGRLARVRPVPLSVRAARTACSPLRARLQDRAPLHDHREKVPLEGREPAIPGGPRRKPVVEVGGLHAQHGPVAALRGVDLEMAAGEVVALMGRNGAGKSTLLATLAGVHRPARGTVRIAGAPTFGARPSDVVRRIALVPQQPADLLWAQTGAEECAAADRHAGLPAGATAALLERISPGVDPQRHPRDLSEGQRLALALAVIGGLAPRVLALDEPTRGLDYAAKDRLTHVLRERAASGAAVILATHDVELAVSVADRIVVLADGEVVTDGPVREVATGSPLFAPQVAKVMAPLPLLTVADVAAALA